MTRLVIGIGTYNRGDDAAGLAVAEGVRNAGLPGVVVKQLAGDQLGLLDVWADKATQPDGVFVIDAMCSGSPAGTVARFDAATPLGSRFDHRGTHTFSLADVIELARSLSELPEHLTGYGIEGATFAIGAPMSPQAAKAVKDVTSRLIEELACAPG
jgi:hydrogenase maturation protease